MNSSTADATTVSAPTGKYLAGIRFHRLGRAAPGYRWWRPVAGTVVVLAGTVLVLVVVVRVVAHTGDLPGLGMLTGRALSLAGVALALPVTLAVTRWIGARPIGTLVSVVGRLRWRRLGLCLLLAAPVSVTTFVAIFVLYLMTTDVLAQAQSAPAVAPRVGTDPLIALAVSLPVFAVLSVVQTTTEEVISRGWILQAVGGFTRTAWPAITVQALVFTALHAVSGKHGSVWGYADLIVYSIMIGWLTVSTGGIEAAAALHIIWNGIPTMLLAVVVPLTGADVGSDTSIAGVGWQVPAIHLPAVGIYMAIVWWAARRRPDTALGRLLERDHRSPLPPRPRPPQASGPGR